LKRVLLQAYHGEGRNVSDRDTLVAIAGGAGLDIDEARRILETDQFAVEVRERERFYQQHGIQAVPSVIFNGRHLVQGGQPPETFEQVLRQLSGLAG
jgi:predicted DsbA family dithiol-disulfide isomerase